MGAVCRDDYLISSLLDLVNLRFAPFRPHIGATGGILEMWGLQQKFNVFSREHLLKDSFAVLGLGGFWNPTLKSRWYHYLDDLKRCDSDQPGVSGHDRIIDALVDNLRSPAATDLGALIKDLASPEAIAGLPAAAKPVYFTVHSSDTEGRRVLVTPAGQPLAYMADTYLIISMPMNPCVSKY